MLKVQILDKRCAPSAGSAEAAGLDLRMRVATSAGYTAVNPGVGITFGTGVKMKIPKGWVGLLNVRSSLGKLKFKLDNGLGFIDSDYIGEIRVVATNESNETIFLRDFERVCQIVIVPHYNVTEYQIVHDLEETVRGEGGFGSSGRD